MLSCARLSNKQELNSSSYSFHLMSLTSLKYQILLYIFLYSFILISHFLPFIPWILLSFDLRPETWRTLYSSKRRSIWICVNFGKWWWWNFSLSLSLTNYVFFLLSVIVFMSWSSVLIYVKFSRIVGVFHLHPHANLDILIFLKMR